VSRGTAHQARVRVKHASRRQGAFTTGAWGVRAFWSRTVVLIDFGTHGHPPGAAISQELVRQAWDVLKGGISGAPIAENCMLHAHERRRFHARLKAENLGKLAHVGWRIAGPIRRGAHKEYVRSLCDELQVLGGRVAATSKLLGELIAGEHVHDLKVRCCGLPLPDEPFEPVLGVTTLRAVDAEHTRLLPRRLRRRGHCARRP